MEFSVLGPLEVFQDGKPLALGGSKQRALLAALLLQAGQVVSADRLIDDLWGDEPPPTAAHTIQVFVSRLRKALETSDATRRLVTRPPGYAIDLAPDELDLARFERLAREARDALGAGSPERASTLLGDALALWRGEPLADFAYEPFAQQAIARLEEIRLGAVEDRIDADLACGRHASLVGDLEALVATHPLRERLRGQLMLALYRSGRQAEALEAFQAARRTLVDELGIDPSPALQRLERAILQHDPELEPAPREAPDRTPASPPVPERQILVLAGAGDVDALLAIVEPLARSASPHALILTTLVTPGEALAPASSLLNERREALAGSGIRARAVAFTSADPGEDVARLTSVESVDLALLGVAVEALGDLPPAAFGALTEAPCDVALASGIGRPGGDGGVVVPFGGSDHDWAALELGAWIASARRLRLRLLGTDAREEDGRRDASRLLALAALSVQQLVGVATEPELAPAGLDGVLAAADGAALVVTGVPEHWRQDGIGSGRQALAAGASAPILLVRRGLRPGGLAPGESLTRFTWSLAG